MDEFFDDSFQTHDMKLREPFFTEMLEGRKTVEIRLNDEKRQRIMIGDFVSFRLPEEEDERGLKLIVAEVIALHRYVSFAQFFDTELKEKSGFSAYTKEEAVQKMREFYSIDEEERYGVLGIELQVI